MQLIMRATTAVACTYGVGITTDNVQVLPEWAPPIEYVGTTAPWLAILTNITSAGAAGGFHAKLFKVRAYGRETKTYSGREVVALHAAITTTTNKKPLLTLTYRALGELVRP